MRLRDVLDEKFYTDLPGGLMESLGQLFKNGAKLYVYPSLDKKTGKLITVENLEVAPHLRHLYAHLRRKQIHREHHQLQRRRAENLFRRSPRQNPCRRRKPCAKLIPAPIFEVIKAKKLFGWQQKAAAATPVTA